MLHTLDPEIKNLTIAILCKEKFEALKKGDLRAFHEVDDLIRYVKLDPSDPRHDEKLRVLYQRMHFRKLVSQAEEVISGTGKPMSFEDAHTAISDAIDAATEAFECMPCPKHAAALLGLIDCRNALIEVNTEESEEADETDPEEEDYE